MSSRCDNFDFNIYINDDYDNDSYFTKNTIPEWETDDINDLEEYLNDVPKIDQTPLLINNTDYTLNSPLILDPLEAFIKYLKSDTVTPLYYHKTWLSNKQWLTKLGKNWSTTKSPVRFHSILSDIWRSPNIDLKPIKNLIKDADNMSKETFSIIQIYMEKWVKKSIKFMSRSLNNPDTLLYGSHMIDALKMTWIMNAGSNYELKSLAQSLNIKLPDCKDLKAGIIYDSSIFGQVLIGHGILYIPKLHMIWDRNMLLLYKDTATARFHTLFSIQHRQFHPYTQNHYKNQVSLYNIGDDIIKYDVIAGYETIGMLEPLSSLRLSELSGSFRPEIPSFPHFRQHIESKFAELQHRNPRSRDLYNLINSMSNKDMLLTVYGSFRHWGHPFIDYMEGLSALYKNVTSTENKIDKDYAELLASDLAFKILKREFHAKYRWFVNGDLLPDIHPLKEHILNNTWPAIDVILDFPPVWHKLPLLKVWQIPEVVDPTLIYSDKTHSIQRSELINHLKFHPNKPIPTRKVLQTLINTESTNWPEFLQQINDHGLSVDDLIIGLKAKEREIKWKGRFFALMSWKLREYFVFTEYLIKQNVIPLFKGLTMADDQTTLMKKMLTNTAGQGSLDYKNITIANHIDYEKWNNFQRFDSTYFVFRVLGQFFGLPELFSRTHEFFGTSLIYYRDRPDLMMIRNGQVVNKFESQRVCWEGQAGGLEGLRQKGWSVLNLLCIERESRIRNTEVKILAQGDNQVICTMYKLNPSRNLEELRQQIQAIIQNNDVIMSSIRKATKRIGLRINEDETLQSADMLIYGKVIIYRGNITSLDEKRYSRITCTTNDQLPSLGNILATVATNCLTVSHFSKSPLNPIVNYNWLGNFVLSILDIHSPALRASPKNVVSDPITYSSASFRISALYLDPSIGGISGMSLTRFHLRMFPDPITESLSFWKIIASTSRNSSLQTLAISMGNPKVLSYSPKHFSKLIEDPISLNLPKGLSAQNLIKSEIKQTLYNDPSLIKHEIIREAIRYVKESEDRFLGFLESIKPCFPRFISEFRASSYFGMTDGIIGLFENSKTIRNVFKAKFRGKVDEAILKCEKSSIEALIRKCKNFKGTLWKCSATQADRLRKESWARDIVGMTVPHPIEMINNWTFGGISCSPCSGTGLSRLHVIGIVPQGILNPDDIRGPYHPYLGSATKENTSLIQSWEKDTDISFIKKASNMRRAFHWFVDPDSNLGKVINNNLESLTGEPAGSTIQGFKRTGSALHRYGCSRVSSGGYIANSAVYGTRMIISTDNFQMLGDQNYDFMYQPLMLFTQQTIGEVHNESGESMTYHFHVSCTSCIRKIEEPILNSSKPFIFPDMSHSLAKWKPGDSKWLVQQRCSAIPQGDWESITHEQKSYEVGCIQSVIFGHLYKNHSDGSILTGLFPLGLRGKLTGDQYLAGLQDGLYRAAAIEAIHRRIFYKIENLGSIIRACYLGLVASITSHGPFLIFIQSENIMSKLRLIRHRVPPSYPLNTVDTGNIARSYLESYPYDQWERRVLNNIPPLWIFADFMSAQLSGYLLLTYELLYILDIRQVKIIRLKCKELGDLLSALRTGDLKIDLFSLFGKSKKIYSCDQEVRHAIKYSSPSVDLLSSNEEPEYIFSKGYSASITTCTVEYQLSPEPRPIMTVPQIQNPLISGLRIPQLATGSFLKIEGILDHLKFDALDMLCGGDGSGGISSCLLRRNIYSRLIFNSLLDMTNLELNGSLPQPPSAISYLSPQIRDRCVNLKTVWELPQDLSRPETWKGFLQLKVKHRLRVNLAIFDMEIISEQMIQSIDRMMIKYIPILMEKECTVIVKSYVHRIIRPDNLLERLGSLFHIVVLTQTQISSSHTSEVYLIFQRLRTVENIRLYPAYTTITQFLTNCFCFRTYDSEFDRALKVFSEDTTKGIPRGLIPDPLLELSGIWVMLSDDKISATRLYQLTKDQHLSGSELGYTSLCLVSNKILPTSKWLHQGQFPIPSDKVLSSFFAYLVGVNLYVALCSRDQSLAYIHQSLINQPFYIFISVETVKKESCEQNSNRLNIINKLSWSFKQPKKLQKYKKIYLQDKLALIGSTIRYLASYDNNATRGLISSLNLDYVKFLNKNLTKQHIQKHTGLTDFWN